MTQPQPRPQQKLVLLGSDTYLVDACSTATVCLDGTSASELEPVTFLNIGDVGSKKIDSAWLNDQTQSMLAEDDVYNKLFQVHVLLNTGSNRTEDVVDDNTLNHTGRLSFVSLKNDVQLTDGPYFMLGRSLYRCSRLYPDPCGAFMFGVTQDNTDHNVYHRFDGPGIPVPSRLYSGKPSDSLPLAAKRFAVKDIIDVLGLPTTASCKAFASMHDAASPTAPVVAKLISLGAVLVGKTKTSQFASGECAIDWVDYQCPFNIRGDGTFAPYCSSTGSASAVAAYDWLDIAIGSDTLGSIIQPAFGHGVFGIRPTHGLSDMTGCLPVSEPLDTIGFLSRKLSDLHLFSKYTFGEKCPPRADKFPTCTMLPSAPMQLSTREKKLWDALIKRMEEDHEALTSKLNIDDGWKDPLDGSGSVEQSLKTTLAHIQLLGSYENNLVFRSAYKKKNGHEPYVNPMVRYKWDLGAQLTSSNGERARMERCAFQTHIHKAFEGGGVLVIPANPPELDYRDDDYYRPFEERAKQLQGFGFNLHQCSFLGGLPAIVVPIGQLPVVSKTTGKKTYRPFCVTIVGPPGSDLALMGMLENVLPHSEVLTGEIAFPIQADFTH